ncbi:MAG: hypothetical protein GQ574_26115 [Crocinitomix sp.]|nr:hypothetical protein [Crocinitomix sp.]
MTDDFFDFIKAPSKEHFLKSQRHVIEHKNYDPYTGELDDLMAFMDAKDFQKVIDFKSINTLLSPSAHLMKHHAAKQINDDLNAKSEWFLFNKILDNLLMTGDGSKEQPYLVTQISDERDIIQSMEDEVLRQSLVKADGKSYDLLNTKSGKAIYFDITQCMEALAAKFNADPVEEAEATKEEDNITETPTDEPQKKWWKFW